MFNLVNASITASRTLLFIYVGVHVLALFSICYFAEYLLIRLALILLLIIVFVSAFKKSVLLTEPRSIVAINWNPDDKALTLLRNNNEWVDVASVKQRLVLPFLVYMLLKIDDEKASQAFIVFSDSCSPDVFRKLKVLVAYSSIRPD